MLREFKFIVAQSICTHYSSLSSQPDIFLGSGTLKNQVQNMDLKKAGKEAAWPFLFLNNNDPVFCSLLFSGPCFGPDFFLSSRP